MVSRANLLPNAEHMHQWSLWLDQTSALPLWFSFFYSAYARSNSISYRPIQFQNSIPYPSINTLFSPWITKRPCFTVCRGFASQHSNKTISTCHHTLWEFHPKQDSKCFDYKKTQSGFLIFEISFLKVINFLCILTFFLFLEFVSSVSKGEGENRWARWSTCTQLEFFAFLERYPVSLFAGFLLCRYFLLSLSHARPFFFIYFEFFGKSFSFFRLVWFILSAVWSCWATSVTASCGIDSWISAFW